MLRKCCGSNGEDDWMGRQEACYGCLISNEFCHHGIDGQGRTQGIAGTPVSGWSRAVCLAGGTGHCAATAQLGRAAGLVRRREVLRVPKCCWYLTTATEILK